MQAQAAEFSGFAKEFWCFFREKSWKQFVLINLF
jgi:hypothetical protein